MAEVDAKREISRDDIREALRRITESETFSRSERSRSFITYLVETEQSGEVERLKGFSIAMDVFGRSEDFDPASDAVVRVQAGRLRELLDNYYETEGANDPVRIDVPRGTYAPAYSRLETETGSEARDTSPETVETGTVSGEEPTGMGDGQATLQANASPINPATPMNPFVVTNIRKFWLAIGTMIALLSLILLLTFYELRSSRNETSPVVSGGQSTEVPVGDLGLPRLVVRADGNDNETSGSLALSALSEALSRFSEVTLRSAIGSGSARETLSPVDYEMRVRNIEEETLVLEVVHATSGDVIWTGPLSIAESAGRSRAMKGVLTLLLPPDGLIYAHAVEKGVATALMTCMKATQDFFRSQTSRTWSAAYSCHKTLAGDEVQHTLISADLASLMVEELMDQYPTADTFTAEDAIDEGRKAVNLGPSRASAHRALARALHHAGDTPAAFDAMKRAFELNPNDLNIAAAWGYALYFIGRYEDAVSVLSEAVRKTDRGLPWWHHTLFLSAIAAEDDAAVQLAALGLARETRSVYVGAQLVAAELADNARTRDSLLARLQQSKSSYADNPEAYYQRHLPDAAVTRVTSLLRAAGFSWN